MTLILIQFDECILLQLLIAWTEMICFLFFRSVVSPMSPNERQEGSAGLSTPGILVVLLTFSFSLWHKVDSHITT